MSKIDETTIEYWKHIPAGKEASTGFGAEMITAPKEPGLYTLYEKYYIGSNTHAGWRWEKEN